MFFISESFKIAVFLVSLLREPHPGTCTYQTFDWDHHRKTVQWQPRIVKPYSELTPEERGPIPGCSVCEEDQTELSFGKLQFKFCRKMSEGILKALVMAQEKGMKIISITGYRVGKSKGELNSKGMRTQFSNHSYGLAMDVNREFNGLYDHCLTFQSNCRLLLGGAYRPGSEGSIEINGPLFQELSKLGMLWGGNLKGDQKDFMHFSFYPE